MQIVEIVLYFAVCQFAVDEVEVIVVADGFGNGQVQHVVLRIAPVGVGQAVSGVLFFARHLPLVPGDELAVVGVVEAENIGKRPSEN